MKLLSKGAEAHIYVHKNYLIKYRISKGYRIDAIDEKLRSSRTRRERKVLEKLAFLNIPAPRLLSNDILAEHSYSFDDSLVMDNIPGKKVRDILTRKNYLRIAENIARNLAKMHKGGIVHGDPTTSNMIFYKDAVYFIDFGLSSFSQKIEDKAVDIHLFRQAIEAQHHTLWELLFSHFTKNYVKHSKDGLAVMKRFERVESRGRNKIK